MWLKLCIYFYNYDTSIIVLKGYDRPTLNEIINYKIRDQVAVDWYDLGVRLLPDNIQLDIIEKNFPTDAKTRCNEMFKYWLQVDTTASWNKLIESLKRNKKHHLAEIISKQILQGKCVAS